MLLDNYTVFFRRRRLRRALGIFRKIAVTRHADILYIYCRRRRRCVMLRLYYSYAAAHSP